MPLIYLADNLITKSFKAVKKSQKPIEMDYRLKFEGIIEDSLKQCFRTMNKPSLKKDDLEQDEYLEVKKSILKVI